MGDPRGAWFLRKRFSLGLHQTCGSETGNSIMAKEPAESAPTHESARPRAANGQSGSAADAFRTFASKASYVVGTKWAFLAAVLLIVAWAASGPFFHYSDTWQLVVNTATTVVTFLIVFLIQNSQNRDARAIHLKLDEIIRSIERAENEMIHIEKLSDEELEAMTQKFEKIRREYESRSRRAETRGLESGAQLKQKTSD
jgi:low affinity Fe/Cu permease